MIARKLVAAAGLIAGSALALSLGACSSGMSRFDPSTQSTYYLDGTGPSAERTGSTRRVARRAPVSAEAARAQDVSSTTGSSRAAAPREQPAHKPFSEEWWENERREDARLKQKMNICRGC